MPQDDSRAARWLDFASRQPGMSMEGENGQDDDEEAHREHHAAEQHGLLHRRAAALPARLFREHLRVTEKAREHDAERELGVEETAATESDRAPATLDDEPEARSNQQKEPVGTVLSEDGGAHHEFSAL